MDNKISEIWIDALDFEKGGWKEDTQFVHLMGSPYLIAAGEPGTPVDDAVMKIEIPEKCNYRIWVFDRNWMRFHSPGKFTLLVNGEGNGKILGAMPSDRWLWEIAGDFVLEKGYNTISLHDLTGYFGRCASLLLTTDMDYVPSPEIEKIHSERARIKGLNTEIVNGGEYDIIVAGGGPGGVPAAITAARMGVKVLLIQDRSVLGGNGSSEVGITFDGASAIHLNARETGIAEEIRRLRDYDKKYYGDWTRALETLVAQEKNLSVIYNNRIDGVKMDGSTIKSVTTMNIRTLTKSIYSAKFFLDCTGDGWLGYYSGAKYRFGREASIQHGENLAPDIADTITMSGCIKSGNLPFFFNAEKPVVYHAPEWIPKLPDNDEDLGRKINGNGGSLLWWLEAPNNYDDMWDGEETRDALLLVILGYYDYIKNRWSKKELAQNLRLDFVSIFNGRRESRRLVGDYILTQQDCISGRDFEDTVAYSGWPIDIHNTKGVYSGKEGTMYCVKFVPLVKIPYRCLYSKNINNLLFAGRNISCTHMAIGTIRVQNTIATLGQAAGTAAALCIIHNETPRGIYEHYIHELQQTLLKNDQFIPNVKNDDKNDVCLASKVTASSYSSTEIFNTLKGTDGELKPLDVSRCCVINLNRQNGNISELWLKLSSDLTEPCMVSLNACDAGWSAFDFVSNGKVISAQAIVPPCGEHWVKFSVNIPVAKNEYMDKLLLKIWLDPAKGISWRSVENLSFNWLAGKIDENGEWRMQSSQSFRVSTQKPEEVFANCIPENVINGWSRIIDAQNYEWVSDPKEKLPQWIELSLKTPAEINTVSLAFNTDLNNPGTCWDRKIPCVPSCVKDYNIEVFDGFVWYTVANVTDNYMRKRVHSFKAMTVEKIRANVTATWGDPSARIQEIRAYLED